MTSIPLSAGQMDGHSLRFRDWIEHDALDIFMPNSLFNGGMTETRRVAALAQIYNRPLSDAGGGGLYSVHHVAGFRGGTLRRMPPGRRTDGKAASRRPAASGRGTHNHTRGSRLRTRAQPGCNERQSGHAEIARTNLDIGTKKGTRK